MKLTNKQLRQIIKEELDTVTQEGALEQAKHLTKPPKNDIEAAVRKMYDMMTPAGKVRKAFDEAMKLVYREHGGGPHSTLNEQYDSIFSVRITDEAVEVFDEIGRSVMYVTSGQHKYYEPMARARYGGKGAKEEIAKQVSQKVGKQLGPENIKLM